MSKSVNRVQKALEDLKLDAAIQHMPESTRTAEDAATACKCSVGQIVKSMIFEGAETGKLKLLLVSGKHTVDLAKAAEIFGESLIRADPKRVRSETGFAIGGVAPLGHLSATDTWMDAALLDHDLIWAAAGAPNAVFSLPPRELKDATASRIFQIG
ncbi:YbaK/EbsC family protein [Roseobacter sp.]|uniref:YbaK/EbsC family protein n=1 Tax=Roseobacter sp. TaxID=1907202 RepID=UPI0029662427|nr:YbaK/EbsC family protein [Roseobacter sp.]MDW3181397.1 YbaK/EbsC family protein [Roseobacter sp.]